MEPSAFVGYWFIGALTATERSVAFSSWGLLTVANEPVLPSYIVGHALKLLHAICTKRIFRRKR